MAHDTPYYSFIWDPFHAKSNYVVQWYKYKSMTLTKPGTYVKGYNNYYICIKFENSNIKYVLSNVKRVQITN